LRICSTPLGIGTVDVGDEDGRLLCQPHARRRADATGTAGDDHDLAAETAHR
jgi:hypothetical protein